jgi:cytochrome c biogenesis protein
MRRSVPFHFWGRRLASLKLSFALMLLLLASVWWAYRDNLADPDGGRAFLILAPVLGALILNLALAIVYHPRFRRQWPLLLFHLCLLLIVLLVAVGQLTRLKGWVEVAVGSEFSGQLTGFEAGPLHPWHIEGLRFRNEGFSIDYDIGPMRSHTFNRVSWHDGDALRQVVIGDQKALNLEGYRFYTTPNKGFAPVFVWKPDGEAAVQRGVVHLPSYPGNRFKQAQAWRPPGAREELWVQLDFDEVILDPLQPSRFRPPREHRLIVRQGEGARTELRPGDRLTLGSGLLIYQGLTTWMGYQIYYDPTLHWLLAACFLAVASLGAYFWERHRQVPWRRD